MIQSSTSDANVLEFDDVKHKYWLNGDTIPGSTTVIKAGYPKSEALVKWMIKQGIEEYETGTKLKKAADIGSFVHKFAYLTELNKTEELKDLQTIINTQKDRKQIRNGIGLFQAWRSTEGGQNKYAEQIICSPSLKVAGTFDRLDEVGGKIRLRDYKTSSGIYIDQFIQLGGYALQLKEWFGIKVDELEVVRFGKTDAKVETKLIDDKIVIRDLQDQFERCVKTYYFRKKYE